MDIFYFIVSILLIGLAFIDKYYWSKKRFDYINEIIRNKDAVIESKNAEIDLLKDKIVNPTDLHHKLEIIDKAFEKEKYLLKLEQEEALKQKDIEKEKAVIQKMEDIEGKEIIIQNMNKNISELKQYIKDNPSINQIVTSIADGMTQTSIIFESKIKPILKTTADMFSVDKLNNTNLSALFTALAKDDKNNNKENL